MTQGERLIRIETLLERMDKKLEAIEADLIEEKERNAALRNKGAGILVGVAIAAGALGASAATLFEKLATFLK